MNLHLKVDFKLIWPHKFILNLTSDHAHVALKKQTTKAAAEHKQEGRSLNLNLSLQACLYLDHSPVVLAGARADN